MKFFPDLVGLIIHW